MNVVAPTVANVDAAQPLAAALASRAVLVVVGAGGVGKTTLSAALGVAAAAQGRRALVLTVDPARRLANALGLQALDEHVQSISIDQLRAAGIEAKAPLDVAMLDVKSTFDRVISRNVGDPERVAAVLANPLYRTASTALAGSQEYMAIERLAEVVAERRYDIVVLDTPPSAHALDFLEAPQRLIDLFDNATFRTLLRPFSAGATSTGIFARSSLVMRGVGRFTSAESFHDLLTFFGALSAGFDAWVQRGREVLALLRSQGTAFVIVSATDDASREEGAFLLERLRSDGLQVAAWAVNRVARAHLGLLDVADALPEHLAGALADAPQPSAARRDAADAARRLGQAALTMARIAAADRALVAGLRRNLGAAPPLCVVARREIEPADLGELAQLAQELACAAAVGDEQAPR